MSHKHYFRRNLKLFLYFYILSVIGCAEQVENKKNIDFKEIINSNINLFEIPNDVVIGFPSELSYLDSAIIVLSYKSLNFITIWDLKSNQIIETGKRGNGPGELILPVSLTTGNLNEKCFEVYDYAQKKLFVYNIDSCRTNHWNSKPLKSYPINDIAYKCSALGKSYTVSTGLFDNYFHFQISDSNAIIIIKFGDYEYNPYDKNEITNKSLAYQGELAVQDSNIVWACSNAQIIETFTFTKDNKLLKNGYLINQLPDYISENKNGGYSSAMKRKNKKGYLSIATTKEFIFLLYSGVTMDKYISEERNGSSEIHVFDWNCNPVKKILLDKEIIKLTISEVNNKIYGLIHDPEPKLISIQL